MSLSPLSYRGPISLTISALLLVWLAGCQSAPKKSQNIQTIKAIAQQSSDNSPSPQTLASNSPLYQLGDQWQWSDGYGLRVTAVNGAVTTLQRLDSEPNNPQWQKRDGLFLLESFSAGVHRRRVYTDSDPHQLFPLTDKKSVVFQREYLADQTLRTHRTSWVVDGRETVRVPAGEFNCWVLTRRSRSLSSDWTSYERWWYSPKAKNYVRLEYQYGGHPSGARVLMSYSVNPPLSGRN